MTFFRDEDYSCYLALLAEECRRQAVAVWAYCLMPNHSHLETLTGRTLLPQKPGPKAQVKEKP